MTLPLTVGSEIARPSASIATQATLRKKLPGLDGLRALAALGVTFHHFEQTRFVFGLPNLWTYAVVQRLGGLCVSLFFVLSGFLITLLLRKEYLEHGRIAIGSFYMRRILRVWPLYFVITIIGFFILPFLPAYAIPGFLPVLDADYWRKLALYVAFMPHVEASFFAPVNYAGVLWSVGVEEWFYLGWPFLLLATRGKLWLVLPVIVAFFLFGRHEFREGPAYFLFSQIRFDHMAIGAMGAILATTRSTLLNALMRVAFTRRAQVIAIVTIVAAAILLKLGMRLGLLADIVFPLSFLWIIVDVSMNPNSIINLEHPLLRWLGKLSYGIYCFNWITLVTALVVMRWAVPDLSGWVAHVFHFAFGLLLTVGVAALSYRCLEAPFLSWKVRSFSSTEPQVLRGDPVGV